MAPNQKSLLSLSLDNILEDADGIAYKMQEKNLTTSLAWVGKYSDLTINCRGRVFKVHRVILTSRCAFFESCCGNGFEESETRNINMDDDDPDALESLIKYLYTMNIDHIKYRNVSHEYLPSDWFMHLTKVWQLADKYDQPLLRAAMASIVTNEPNCDGLFACPDCADLKGKDTRYCITLHDHLIEALAALGATFKDDFPDVVEPAWHKIKFQGGLIDAVRRSPQWLSFASYDNMDDTLRVAPDKAAKLLQEHPQAARDIIAHFSMERFNSNQKLDTMADRMARLEIQVKVLGGDPVR